LFDPQKETRGLVIMTVSIPTVIFSLCVCLLRATQKTRCFFSGQPASIDQCFPYSVCHKMVSEAKMSHAADCGSFPFIVDHTEVLSARAIHVAKFVNLKQAKALKLRQINYMADAYHYISSLPKKQEIKELSSMSGIFRCQTEESETACLIRQSLMHSIDPTAEDQSALYWDAMKDPSPACPLSTNSNYEEGKLGKAADILQQISTKSTTGKLQLPQVQFKPSEPPSTVQKVRPAPVPRVPHTPVPGVPPTPVLRVDTPIPPKDTTSPEATYADKTGNADKRRRQQKRLEDKVIAKATNKKAKQEAEAETTRQQQRAVAWKKKKTAVKKAESQAIRDLAKNKTASTRNLPVHHHNARSRQSSPPHTGTEGRNPTKAVERNEHSRDKSLSSACSFLAKGWTDYNWSVTSCLL
jgi:hypothetical protein